MWGYRIPALLEFLQKKWFVSRFCGSREADLHFSPGSFVAIIEFLVMISRFVVYTKYSPLDDVVFV